MSVMAYCIHRQGNLPIMKSRRALPDRITANRFRVPVECRRRSSGHHCASLRSCRKFRSTISITARSLFASATCGIPRSETTVIRFPRQIRHIRYFRGHLGKRLARYLFAYAARDRSSAQNGRSASTSTSLWSSRTASPGGPRSLARPSVRGGSSTSWPGILACSEFISSRRLTINHRCLRHEPTVAQFAAFAPRRGGRPACDCGHNCRAGTSPAAASSRRQDQLVQVSPDVKPTVRIGA